MEYTINCDASFKAAAKKKDSLELNYRVKHNRNVDLYFDDMIPYESFDDCAKDFIEISAFLYTAEIRCSLIENDESEKEEKSKLFHFHIPVRDYDFWRQPEIKNLLSELLSFITGNDYHFIFHRMIEQQNDDSDLLDPICSSHTVVTFLSGGIDSVAGVIDLIDSDPKADIILLSHQPDLSGVAATQNKLFLKIEELFPGNCSLMKFRCNLLYNHSNEKDYATRSLLYNSVAFGVSWTHKVDGYYIYENGISAINFKGINTFASSSGYACHPKTLYLLERLYERITGKMFPIYQPFLFLTKAQVINELRYLDQGSLLDLSVSCERKIRIPPGYSHCGTCGPCINRRIVLTLINGWQNHKNSFYIDLADAKDLTKDQKVILEIMIMEMIIFDMHSIDAFCRKWKDDLFSVQSYIRPLYEYTSVTDDIYKLCLRYFKELKIALSVMWVEYTAPWSTAEGGAFFTLLNECYKFKGKLQDGRVVEPGTKYGASEGENEPPLEEIPARKVKKVAIELCYELIKTNEISDQTDSEELIEKVINTLSVNYLLTEKNKRSIRQYFLSGVLQIKNEKGEYYILNNNKKSIIPALAG